MKYQDKASKIGRYMWIWITNKVAKFHTKRLNRSENIPKSFFWGVLFLKHPVHAKRNTCSKFLSAKFILINK